MEVPEVVVGVLLAGGRSSRMGGGDRQLERFRVLNGLSTRDAVKTREFVKTVVE